MTTTEVITTPLDILRSCVAESNGDLISAFFACEYIFSSNEYKNQTTNHVDKLIVNIPLSLDVHNRQAQAILDRSFKAVKAMISNAKRDLNEAIKQPKAKLGKSILQFVDKYRLQLARLLTTTTLASVLEGMREVSSSVPSIDEEQDEEEQEARKYTKSTSRFTVSFPQGEGYPNIGFIKEVVKELSENEVITKEQYNEISKSIQNKAFTIAGMEATYTLQKIKELLSSSIQGKGRGAYEAFRKEILEGVAEGTLLSQPHQEMVFRTNVQSAFSDGQLKVLSSPSIRDNFPYSAYSSIHDDRARDSHTDLETHGVNGTNIYRTDDPVFQLFRPPWDYNCRCSWTPMSVKQAAEAGVEEAKLWLETGTEPYPPAYVKMPGFSPSDSFERIDTLPLSIQLSLESIFNDSNIPLGMVDGEWRGSNPPGGTANWAPSTPGPRGGKRWKPRNNQAIKDANATDGNTKPIARSDKGGISTRDNRTTGTGDENQTSKTSSEVAPEVTRSSATEDGTDRTDTDTGSGTQTTEDISSRESRQPPSLSHVNRGITNYARHFRKIGQPEIADWFLEMKEHINEVGVDTALNMLGENKSRDNPISINTNPGERVQYKGTAYFGEGFENEYDFLEKYLDEIGITLQKTDIPDPKLRTIASAPVPTSQKHAKKGDVIAKATNIQTKLEESQLLPGLEKSEDIHKLVGHEVTQFTPDVLKKFDDTYGKGKWLIKPYGDEAYAGFGVFFPQRIKEIQKSSKQTLFDTGKKLSPLGYSLSRDDSGTCIGIKDNKTNQVYKFGTSEIRNIPNKKVKKLAAIASASAPSEKGTRLPLSPEDSLRQDYGIMLHKDESGRKVLGVTDEDGKYIAVDSEEWKTYGEYDSFGQVLERAITSVEEGAKGDNRFMIQPAFEAIGVSELDRALGATWETSTEGRVHITTRNGKASVVPYATLASRHDAFPVVFYNDDIRAMEKAVQDTIDALPESERAGQVYSPDVMKTKDGWRVLELNAAVETGQSLWLEENPFVIDSYVSTITGREPAHAKFMRELLQGKVDELRPGKKPVQSKEPKLKLFADKDKSTNTPNTSKSSTTKVQGKSSAFSTDDHGREHKGKGPGGGQFVKGSGGSSHTDVNDESSTDSNSRVFKYKESTNPAKDKPTKDVSGIGNTLVGLTARSVASKLSKLGDYIIDRLPFGVRHAYRLRKGIQSAIWAASHAVAGSAAKRRGIQIAKNKGIEDPDEIEEYAEKYKTRTVNTLAAIGAVVSTGLGVAGIVSAIGPGNLVTAGTAIASFAAKAHILIPAGTGAKIGSTIASGAVSTAKFLTGFSKSMPLALKLASIPVLPAAYLAYSGIKNPLSTLKGAMESVGNAIEKVKDKLRSNLDESEG